MPGHPLDPGPSYRGESNWDRFGVEIDTCMELINALETARPLVKAVQGVLTVGNSTGEDLETQLEEMISNARGLMTQFCDGENP